MSEQTLRLDVYGVRVECTGDGEAIEGLAVHFAWFRTEGSNDSADVRVRLTPGRCPEWAKMPRLRADQVLERGVVYNRGAQTWMDHHGAATSCYDFEAEQGTVWAEDARDRIELGYLMIHSRVGVHLERRGLIRLHCVAIGRGDVATLILSPSGGGKSTLARAILQHTDVQLLGDDMVLVDARGNVWPFHSPLGVTDPRECEGLGTPVSFERRHHAPKWVIPIDAMRPRLARGPHRARCLALAVRTSHGPSRVVGLDRKTAGKALWRDMVVGLGLPQVLELVARRGGRDLWSLAPTATRRSLAAARLLARTRAVELELADPREAAHALADTLG